MDTFQGAIELAKKGFYVFPISPNSKVPDIKKFTEQATRDVDVITKWWVNPLTGKPYPYNIGIATSKFGDEGEALVVVDLDDKGERMGSNAVYRLEKDGFMLPETFEVKTPSGGKHFYYRYHKPVKGGVNVLAKGLDIRSSNQYAVGPYSVIEGNFYVIQKDVTPTECPEWIANTCGNPNLRDPMDFVLADQAINGKSARQRALDYLANDAPIAYDGERNNVGYKVANTLKDFGLSFEETLFYMENSWQTYPPLSVGETEAVVKHAYRYGLKPIGYNAPEKQFEIANAVLPGKEKDPVAKINDNFALMIMGGKHFYLYERKDSKGRDTFDLLNEAAFKRLFSTQFLMYEDRRVPISKLWLEWSGRREYYGIDLDFIETNPSYYNLWKGFAVKETSFENANDDQKKGLELFLKHLKENLCDNDEGLFQWMINYFAHMFQFPEDKRPMSLILQGLKGTGKSLALNILGSILGPNHYTVISDYRYLTGNFNRHLEGKILVVLDEVYWGGDKKAEGVLKHLISGDTMMIESKGHDSREVTNYLRIVFTTNNMHVVPASGSDERRYTVAEVNGDARFNHDLFRELQEYCIQKNGNELLLHYFLKHKVDRDLVRKGYATEALAQQKILSMHPVHQFWLEAVQRGGLNDQDIKWEQTLSKTEFRDYFYQFWQLRGMTGWKPSENQFLKYLKMICPEVQDVRKSEDGNQIRCYHFPTLEQARKLVEEYIGHKMEWDDEL